jgi:hypothetical protein
MAQWSWQTPSTEPIAREGSNSSEKQGKDFLLAFLRKVRNIRSSSAFVPIEEKSCRLDLEIITACQKPHRLCDGAAASKRARTQYTPSPNRPGVLPGRKQADHKLFRTGKLELNR